MLTRRDFVIAGLLTGVARPALCGDISIANAQPYFAALNRVVKSLADLGEPIEKRDAELPVTPALAGAASEYRLLFLTLRASGLTDVSLAFDAGPGTEDLGGRSGVFLAGARRYWAPAHTGSSVETAVTRFFREAA